MFLETPVVCYFDLLLEFVNFWDRALLKSTYALSAATPCNSGLVTEVALAEFVVYTYVLFLLDEAAVECDPWACVLLKARFN